MRTLYTLIISVFSLFSIIFLACRKNGETPIPSRYFPNDVGDSWQYNATDSAASTPNNPSSPIHYVVNVNITGTTKLLDGKEATIWQYQYPWGLDTNYVRLTNDTVKFFYNASSEPLSNLTYPDLILLVPFQVNEGWSGKHYWVDSMKVLSQIDINSQGQTFTGCYNIYHSYSGPNTELRDHYFFKPNVGIVSKQFMDHVGGPTTYRFWQLKSFTVH